MKRKRFTEEQIAYPLRQAEKRSIDGDGKLKARIRMRMFTLGSPMDVLESCASAHTIIDFEGGKR